MLENEGKAGKSECQRVREYRNMDSVTLLKYLIFVTFVRLFDDK